MLKIGDYNKLVVSHRVEFGFYLTSGENFNILLPIKYAPEGLSEKDEIEVFIYKDSDDRLIATTLRPLAKVGDFACLIVADVNRRGIFLDWGLEKHLLLPYSEIEREVKPGFNCVVYVMLDKLTDRLIATTKYEKHLEKKDIALKEKDRVDLMICRFMQNGVSAIINNKYIGMIYESEIYKKLNIGDRLEGYVKKIRADKKIDLTLRKSLMDDIEAAKSEIMVKIIENGGVLRLGDKSSSEAIKQSLQMSKALFKKAAGGLYKERKIKIGDAEIILASPKE